MKIKCVKNKGNNYLTIGKVYSFTSCDDEKTSGAAIDDEGRIFVYLPNSSHGKFEVVEE